RSGGIMLTTSCRVMWPTLVSETRYFWNAEKGGNFRTTFFGVVIHQARLSGYQGTGWGSSTFLPSYSIFWISGKYRVSRRSLTARACLLAVSGIRVDAVETLTHPLEPQKRKLLGRSRLRAAQNSALSSSGRSRIVL